MALRSGMAGERIAKDTITCNGAISAGENSAMWEEALALRSGMAGERIDMDTITCNGVIEACKKGGVWEEAAGERVDMNTIIRNGAISACKPEPATRLVPPGPVRIHVEIRSVVGEPMHGHVHPFRDLQEELHRIVFEAEGHNCAPTSHS